ncbi:MAG TPA: sigma-E factor negative regulatory protein [Burkholderiales bacterium]
MERISAFLDGEVEDNEISAQLARLKQDPALREAWDTYHLIGDAMRGDAGVAPAFMSRFSAALAQEPTVLAPKAPVRKSGARRIALPLAASFGGVALVAWMALSNNPLMPREEKLAANQPQPVVQAAVKPANGAVNDYLLAHQQFSPSTTMQGVASYVRTVSGREEDMR